MLVIGFVAYRAKKLNRNPYTQEVFEGTRDFEKAMSCREDA